MYKEEDDYNEKPDDKDDEFDAFDPFLEYDEDDDEDDEDEEINDVSDEEPAKYEDIPAYLRPEINRDSDNEVEVKVVGVFEHADPGSVQRFVLVRDDINRTVPILIGPFEALSITMALENESADRPLTHDLMKSVIDKLGGKVEQVLIDDLWRDVFYAKLFISMDNRTIEIDSRPSDAIALALRFKAPIFMSESVLEATHHEET